MTSFVTSLLVSVAGPLDERFLMTMRAMNAATTMPKYNDKVMRFLPLALFAKYRGIRGSGQVRVLPVSL
jgi:hypothetical protein